MSITHRLRRPAQLCAVACALLLVPATTGAAAAAANPTVKERAVAQERYLSSYETPMAQERYLSSYGKPEKLTPPQTPAPSNDTPWLPIALSLAGVLAIVAVSATQLRRVRIRRGRAAQTPA